MKSKFYIFAVSITMLCVRSAWGQECPKFESLGTFRAEVGTVVQGIWKVTDMSDYQLRQYIQAEHNHLSQHPWNLGEGTKVQGNPLLCKYYSRDVNPQSSFQLQAIQN